MQALSCLLYTFPFMVEVLKRYSHPEVLDDLRSAVKAITHSIQQDHVVTCENPAGRRPRAGTRPKITARLSESDIATMVAAYQAGTISGKQLAEKYGISLSSVKR